MIYLSLYHNLNHLTIKIMKNQEIKNPRIITSLQIIRKALKNHLSLTQASLTEGYGKNYVSNVKLTLQDGVKAKSISKLEASEFKTALKEYEKAILA